MEAGSGGDGLAFNSELSGMDLVAWIYWRRAVFFLSLSLQSVEAAVESMDMRHSALSWFPF